MKRNLGRPMTVATIVAGLLVLLVSCVSVERTEGDVIDNRYAVGGGTFATGPVLYIIAGLRERAGMTVVCGAWALDGRSGLLAHASHDVLDGARVSAGGQTLMDGLTDFRKLRYRENQTGRKANCFITEVAWSPDFAAQPPAITTTVYQSRTSRREVTRYDPGPVARVVN